MKLKRWWNKTTRRLLIFVVALVLAGGAVIMQNQIVKQQTTTKKVLVPAMNIVPFSPVVGKLVPKDVVQSEIPEDAITSLDELEGEEWVTGEIGLPAGFPISKTMLMTAKDSKYGQSVELKQGEFFVGVQTDQVRSAGDFIKPGTLADAYVYVEGDNQTPSRLITPEQDPLLKDLLIQDRQNQNGYNPQDEQQNPIPSIAIVKTSDTKVVAALIHYQEEGRVYFAPTGVDRTQVAKMN